MIRTDKNSAGSARYHNTCKVCAHARYPLARPRCTCHSATCEGLALYRVRLRQTHQALSFASTAKHIENTDLPYPLLVYQHWACTVRAGCGAKEMFTEAGCGAAVRTETGEVLPMFCFEYATAPRSRKERGATDSEEE